MKYDFDHWDKTEMTQEEALDWFESEFEFTDGKRCSPTCPQCQATEWAIKALSVMPKKGKWLRDPPEGGYALYKCSVCGECWAHWWASAMTIEKMAKEVRCCPNCGAEMEQKNER